MKKICLVTGASSGIGKEIALGLAKSDFHVVMVCRNVEKGKSALEDIKKLSGSNSLDLLIADLSSQSEVRALAYTIQQRYSALHVLINNAGLVLTKKTYSVDNIEMTLATNHLGPFLLSYLLLDLLKASAPSRIVNVSSAIHKWAKIDLNDLQFVQRKYQFMKAYAQSKLLMNITTQELARRLNGSGVTVNALHPGAVKTNLGSDNTHNLFLKALDKIIKCFFITPSEAAKIPLYVATSPEVENITGKYFVKYKPAFVKTYDLDFVDGVWKKTEELAGLGQDDMKNQANIDY